MNWIIYARVSSVDQNVKQQVNYITNWAIKHNFHIIDSIADKESGRLPLRERKQFLALLEKCQKEKIGILIYNLDRITRNWDDVTYIEKIFRENWKNMPLISTSDSINLSNASGRMMFRIKMAVNCMMPEDMLEKQKIGIARAKEEGKYIGGTKGRTWKQKKKKK